MMNQAQRTSYQPGMQDLDVKRTGFMRRQFESCSTRLNNLAELYSDLRLVGAPIQRRELPQGARERFFEAVARSSSVKPKEVTAKVASIASAGERRNHLADLAARAEVLPLVRERAAVNAQPNLPIKKKSVLHMSERTRGTTGKAANTRSKVKTAVVAASNAVAARIAGIF